MGVSAGRFVLLRDESVAQTPAYLVGSTIMRGAGRLILDVTSISKMFYEFMVENKKRTDLGENVASALFKILLTHSEADNMTKSQVLLGVVCERVSFQHDMQECAAFTRILCAATIS